MMTLFGHRTRLVCPFLCSLHRSREPFPLFFGDQEASLLANPFPIMPRAHRPVALSPGHIVTLLLAFILAAGVSTASAQIAAVGSGSYTTVLPPDGSVPMNELDVPVNPIVTSNVTGPVPTTDWWSSLVFQRYSDNPYSSTLAAQPLNLKARSSGLGIGTGTNVSCPSYFYAYFYQEDFLVRLEDMECDSTALHGYGDWTVTARWDDGTSQLDATMGHGLPFVYFTKNSGVMELYFATGIPSVWYDQNGTLGFTVNGKDYGVFAPSGSDWSTEFPVFQCDLNGQDYMSIACLPDNSPATLALFRSHAFAFVTDTRVSWQYDEAAATVTTDFQIDTVAKEGAEMRPLLALYRHQWLHTDASLLGYSFDSLQGEMKVIRSSSFSTTMAYPGIMPVLPASVAMNPGYDSELMDAYLDDFLNQSYWQLFYRGDTYFGGKDLGIVSSAIRVADMVGRTDVRDYLLTGLKQKLEDWLTASAGETQTLFYYNDTWGTMYGFPASFGTGSELNDHHFHWGYHVMAASVVAMYDPEWALEENWGGMVNMLIRDANAWDREDPLFPFLRCFDPYAGHSWASGHASFGDGNNQESSSEAMQFAAAAALWGSVTGNDVIRDLGIYLYTTEMTAIEQYWFDVSDIVFPAAYEHVCAGMVWGTKVTHESWFSPEPEMIHGINFLPITPSSLYLGRHPDYVQANYDEAVAENGGEPDDWVDIMWEYLALTDPEAALDRFNDDLSYDPEGGESKAHTYYWLQALRSLGQLDPGVTADTPHYAVFDTDDGKNYVFYNPEYTETTIHFSDGTVVTAAPREYGVFEWTDGTGFAEQPNVLTSPVLLGAHPNPFNPVTTIAFDAPHEMAVTLCVYDATGRKVAELLRDEIARSGRNEVVWLGEDLDGSAVSSGVYFCRLETDGSVQTAKMTLLK